MPKSHSAIKLKKEINQLAEDKLPGATEINYNENLSAFQPTIYPTIDA